MATTKKKKAAPKEEDPKKVVGGPARVSYTHVFKPTSVSPDKPDTKKYSCVLMIPKKNKELYLALKRAQQAAIEWGIENVPEWKGKKPANLENRIYDGDEADLDKNPEYEGHWLVKPKSDRKPQVVDGMNENEPLTTDDEFYSGVFARFSIKFYPYGKVGKGIAVQLNHLQKTKDGERFGAAIATADEDFADDWEDNDDEDDEDLMG